MTSGYLCRILKQIKKDIYGAVAQLGERRTCTAKVAGSIPVSSTKFRDSRFGHLGNPIKSFQQSLISKTNIGDLVEWLNTSGCKPDFERIRWFKSISHHIRKTMYTRKIECYGKENNGMIL